MPLTCPVRRPPVSEESMIETTLEMVRRHVAEGHAHVERQKEIIAMLDRDGHDTVEARALLKVFEQSQAQHVAHLHRLETEAGA